MTVTFSPEIKEWLGERKREALLIDPAKAEVSWSFGRTLDPYGVIPDLPEELQQFGREYFARQPGSNIWVSFDDLPDEVREKLWDHPNAKPSFTIKANGEVIWNIDLPEGLEPPFVRLAAAHQFPRSRRRVSSRGV
jgi:hypothetical protein